MIRALLGMVPPLAWAALLAIAAAAGGAWCHRAGAVSVQARWDRVELERERQANADALRNANRALAASTRFETNRASLARKLYEARNANTVAIQAPIDCPASGLAGDVLLPAGALVGVRDAAAGASAPSP